MNAPQHFYRVKSYMQPDVAFTTETLESSIKILCIMLPSSAIALIQPFDKGIISIMKYRYEKC